MTGLISKNRTPSKDIRIMFLELIVMLKLADFKRIIRRKTKQQRHRGFFLASSLSYFTYSYLFMGWACCSSLSCLLQCLLSSKFAAIQSCGLFRCSTCKVQPCKVNLRLTICEFVLQGILTIFSFMYINLKSLIELVQLNQTPTLVKSNKIKATYIFFILKKIKYLKNYSLFSNKLPYL